MSLTRQKRQTGQTKEVEMKKPCNSGNRRRITGLGLAALLVLAASGCDNRVEVRGPKLNLPSAPLPGAAPSGDTMATEVRAIAGVDSVSLKAVGVVRITMGPSESLTVTAPERVIDLLTSEVSGGWLELDRSSPSYQGQASDIHYELSLRQLDELRLDGVGEIEAMGIDSQHFVARLDGVGEIRVGGRVDRQEVRAAGVGTYRGAGLESRVSHVHLSSGSAEIWATERIEGWVGFGSTLEYWGDATVSVQGQGTVKRLGSRP
jgi:hypothetical protein